MRINNYKDLDVWKKSIDLVSNIYELLPKYPQDEKYALVDQMRRSSISVPSNIAEGQARGSEKEFVQFLNFSRGSLAELETQLIISHRLRYLNQSDFQLVMDKIEEINRMLFRLIAYFRRTT